MTTVLRRGGKSEHHCCSFSKGSLTFLGYTQKAGQHAGCQVCPGSQPGTCQGLLYRADSHPGQSVTHRKGLLSGNMLSWVGHSLAKHRMTVKTRSLVRTGETEVKAGKMLFPSTETMHTDLDLFGNSLIFHITENVSVITHSLVGFVCLFLFFNLATPHGLRDLSSPIRDRTQALGSESVES